MLPMPKANGAFWAEKLRRNVERDAESASALREQGWMVLTVWECQIRTDRASTVSRVADEVRKRGVRGRDISPI
jgi:DNA mismatch endonuclease (patch repair protein)